jgi:hypothetical protein
MILNEGRTKLELVFDILRFRFRDNVTFRKWVILTASPHNEWDNLRDEKAATQPLRVCTSRDRASYPAV